jgi:hypothetical protein
MHNVSHLRPTSRSLHSSSLLILSLHSSCPASSCSAILFVVHKKHGHCSATSLVCCQCCSHVGSTLTPSALNLSSYISCGDDRVFVKVAGNVDCEGVTRTAAASSAVGSDAERWRGGGGGGEKDTIRSCACSQSWLWRKLKIVE